MKVLGAEADEEKLANANGTKVPSDSTRFRPESLKENGTSAGDCGGVQW